MNDANVVLALLRDWAEWQGHHPTIANGATVRSLAAGLGWTDKRVIDAVRELQEEGLTELTTGNFIKLTKYQSLT